MRKFNMAWRPLIHSKGDFGLLRVTDDCNLCMWLGL